MDPKATWQAFLDACEAGDLEEARDFLGHLIGWYDKGGFPLDGVDSNALRHLSGWLECAECWIGDDLPRQTDEEIMAERDGGAMFE